MEVFLYSEINHANHHAVEAKDEHGADGDERDDTALDMVERFGEVDECINRYEVYHII